MSATPHSLLSDCTWHVHRPNTAIWFVGTQVLVAASGEHHAALEAAGWQVAFVPDISTPGSIIHEARANSPEFPKMWQALCEAEEWLPQQPVED